MRKRHRFYVSVACAVALALCAIPIMSIVTDGLESGVLTIRGYNLLSMSAWAAIPVFSPIAVLVIVLGHQTKGGKEMEMLLLGMASMVSYVHSVLVSREWLVSVGGSLVDYQVGMLLYPLGLLVLLAIAYNLCGKSGRSTERMRVMPPLPELIE